jgi:MFS family permease
MNLGRLSVNRMLIKKIRASAKDTLACVILITNAFVWYFFVISFLKEVVDALNVELVETSLIWGAHFGGILFSAIIGAAFASKLKGRMQFLVVWMVVGVVASLSSIVLDKTSFLSVLILALFLGVSLGLGMPSCMGYFTERVGVEKRGRVGGAILLLSGLGMFGLGAVSSGNISLQTFILSIWRILGLMLFLPLRRIDEELKAKKEFSYKSLLGQKSFVLYFLPWIMFSLITYLTTPIQSDILGKSTVDFLIIIENLFIGLFAIIGGFISDALGRKRVAIVGFAMLGLGYSILGIYPAELFSWYFYTVIDGIAWGMLFVVFVVTIWGDLGEKSRSDKYYALGVLPFFVSKFLQLTIGDEIAHTVPKEAIFSFTAFFLFIAVLPLFYAPETLPEKVTKDRDLKSYASKALAKAEKQAGKDQKKNSAKAEKENGKARDEPPETAEDEEARKLAEKYY